MEGTGEFRLGTNGLIIDARGRLDTRPFTEYTSLGGIGGGKERIERGRSWGRSDSAVVDAVNSELGLI